ncbi:MAG: SLOG family protein [Oscillospiraceae bacterium]|nr:SLOG family protein [Oscillospiraceae bacterium]
MIKKEQVCCFTGHRKLRDISAAEQKLAAAIEHLADEGVRYFGCGGALGFDTLAALAVIEARKHRPKLKLILVLPCRAQDKHWSEEEKRVYRSVLERADKVVCTAEDYYDGCMQKRNRHLVDGSGWCLCWLETPGGGTSYTVNCAREKGLKILNLAE